MMTATEDLRTIKTIDELIFT